jgi:RNA polymerase sigma-70 factor (ECF subfamily)
MNLHPHSPAFEAALVGLYPELLRCARRLTPNRADAEDLVQDAIERGLRRRALFRTGGLPDRWMATILRRLFVDQCRTARNRARIEGGAALDGIAAPEAAPPPRAWETFNIDDLRRAAARLASPFREVYGLFAFERLTHREIARRLSLPAGTVATRLLRARVKLRAILESGELCSAPIPLPRPAPPAAARPAPAPLRAASM